MRAKPNKDKQNNALLVWIRPCPGYLCYMSFSGTPLGQGRRLDHSSFLGKPASSSSHPPTSYGFGSVFLSDFRFLVIYLFFQCPRSWLAIPPKTHISHPPRRRRRKRTRSCPFRPSQTTRIRRHRRISSRWSQDHNFTSQARKVVR